MEFTSKSLEETNTLAERFLHTLSDHRRFYSSAEVVGLSGNLGSGKTTFAQALAKLLGVTEHITSPTFVIQKRYATTHPIFSELLHIDAYRLKSAEELGALHFNEELATSTRLILIEWPEQVAEILPTSTHHITFTFVDDTTRAISWNS